VKSLIGYGLVGIAISMGIIAVFGNKKYRKYWAWIALLVFILGLVGFLLIPY